MSVGRSGGQFARALLLALSSYVFVAACSDQSRLNEKPTETLLRPTSCRPPPGKPPVRTADAFPGVAFERPVAITRVGSTYFVTEQGGRVRRVHHENEGWQSDPFLDVTAELSAPEKEGGLLGFAPSPDFMLSGEVFASYTGQSPTALFRTVIARFASRDGGQTIDPSSEEVVLSIDRDMTGHNGGRLLFGPDRQLYVGVGDGSWGDPELRAQNPGELFGKILRLDVLGKRPYATPPDNPFVASGRPEVYALGFRNPWSFSFDDDGRLWLGDVGHGSWEELDIVTRGGNYGWPLREGRHCFASPCELPAAVEPIHELSHAEAFSITGGLVYRGTRLPYAGSYLFADFVTGRIWTIETEPPRHAGIVLDSGAAIAGFGEDENREVLVVDYAGGRILRLEPEEAAATGPISLGQLGCLAIGPGGRIEMDPGLVSYEVNAPLWSDGLDKRRWLAIPPGTTITRTRTDEGKLDLPVGSILLKEFASQGRRVETRMFTRDPQLGWQPYTFAWNDAGDDAVLVDDTRTVLVDGATWTIPSRADCFACHAAGLGRVLGFELAQLNRKVGHGPAAANQLAELARLGLFDRPLDEATTPAFPDPYDVTAPVEPRARAYLHANCSFCHGSVGTAQGLLDLRASAPISTMNVVCRSVNDRWLDGVREPQEALVVPGDPARSALVARMASTATVRMPPLGSARVDVVGTDLIAAWVASIDHCPE